MIRNLDPAMLDDIKRCLATLVSQLRPIVMGNDDAKLEWAYQQLRQLIRFFEKWG